MSPTISYNMPDYIHNDLFCTPIGWFYPMSHDIPSTSMPLYPPIWCLKTDCSEYGLQSIMKSWNSHNISIKSHQLFHNSSQFHRCFTSIPFQLLSLSQALPRNARCTSTAAWAAPWFPWAPPKRAWPSCAMPRRPSGDRRPGSWRWTLRMWRCSCHLERLEKVPSGPLVN